MAQGRSHTTCLADKQLWNPIGLFNRKECKEKTGAWVLDGIFAGTFEPTETVKCFFFKTYLYFKLCVV